MVKIINLRTNKVIDEQSPEPIKCNVCGCDGSTYMNSCYATRAGVLKVRPQAIDNDICNPW